MIRLFSRMFYSMGKSQVTLAILLLLSLGSVAQEIKIIDKPVVFDAERVRLSIAYLKDRHNIVQDHPYIKPVMVVLHWTDIPTVTGTFNTFNTTLLPAGRKGIAGASILNVSSQYVVDRDGTIYRLMPDSTFARHVIGLNYCAIGVENIGSAKSPLTDAQLKANEDLIRYLKTKYDIQYVIGHFEYLLFKDTPLWKETDPNYQTVKTDPGIDFMQRIRANLKDLDLKALPIKVKSDQ